MSNSEAIQALAKIVLDNELMGTGSLPPIKMRVEAALSLGQFVPHPEAVKALAWISTPHYWPNNAAVFGQCYALMRRL